MTNAEKIAQQIIKYGPDSVLIHKMTGTPFWLVCEKTEKTKPFWRIVLCDPDKTYHRLVSQKVTDQEHVNLWSKLLSVSIENRIKMATQTLRKETNNNKKNIYAQHTTHIPSCNCQRKTSSKGYPTSTMDRKSPQRTKVISKK